MDNSDFYFTQAAVDYRQERVRKSWRPVRRKHTHRPDVAPVSKPLATEGDL